MTTCTKDKQQFKLLGSFCATGRDLRHRISRSLERWGEEETANLMAITPSSLIWIIDCCPSTILMSEWRVHVYLYHPEVVRQLKLVSIASIVIDNVQATLANLPARDVWSM
jgi:hypothetical protein